MQLDILFLTVQDTLDTWPCTCSP